MSCSRSQSLRGSQPKRDLVIINYFLPHLPNTKLRCMETKTCDKLAQSHYMKMEQPELKPMTSWSQIWWFNYHTSTSTSHRYSETFTNCSLLNILFFKLAMLVYWCLHGPEPKYKNILMPPLPTGGGGIMFSSCPSHCPVSICPLSFNTYFVWHNISFSVKLATTSRHVSVKCRKGFQSQRSKIKIATRKINLYWRRHTIRWCGIECHLFITHNDPAETEP